MKRRFFFTVSFVVLPLLAEIISYLLDPNIFPGYLSFASKIRSMGLTLFYFGLLFTLIAGILTLIPLPAHTIFPTIFFWLFLALALNRSLPYDSGFSPLRVLAFSISVTTSATFYFAITKRNVPCKRMLFASIAFSLLTGSLLGNLFSFPLYSSLFVYLVLTVLFAGLVFLPGKLLAALSIGLFVFLLPSRRSVSPFAAPESLQPYSRVVMVGVDGFSPEVAFELAKQGKLPAIRKLMEQGVSGNLDTLSVPFSPLIWNSIYTGTPPQQHGVMAFTFSHVTGGVPFLSLWLDNWTNSDWIHRSMDILKKAGLLQSIRPVRSQDRREAAIWNILDQNGMNSIVVGGWTSYPPEKIQGIFVSDYALVAPRSLGTYHPVSKEIEETLQKEPPTASWPRDLLRYIRKDEKTHRVALHLLSSNTFNLFFSYYSTVDAFGHHYGSSIHMKNTLAAHRRQAMELRERIYRRVDDYISDYLSHMNPNTLFILCSDHGWYFDKREHNYPIPGALFLYGPRVRRNIRMEASIYQLAPTVIYALGLPPSKAFIAVPLKQAFEGMIPEKPARSYKRQTDFFEVAEQEFDREKREELLDLQYINQ